MTAPTTKRAWKLQEFVAHGSNVNCLALGHKTGRVMVTGGDDRKVNLWTVGKPNCIMSLSGHTSPVEAVRFGNAEEMVVAGSMSGALKLWDLEQAKIIRTLTGHKANIRCLDFHPYGDFVASGSLDTNVKLWDIRRKGCIFTYKGHSNGVNSLRFSPDGRWVASAGEDGLVKIWDLAAGKLLVDLKQHSGPVNSIEFHPSEYLLASGSSDRSIRFWELEKFQCVDCTDYDSNAIRSVVFHPDGACVFGGSTDLLKVYGWEPSRCLDSVNMGWGKVADMAMAQTQLIGASINQTTVSTFVLDLTRVAPIGQVPGTPAPPISSSGRRSITHERPSTTSTKQQLPKPAEEPEEPSNSNTDDAGEDASSTADVKDPREYEQVFKPNTKLAMSPPRQMDPFPAPTDDGVDKLAANLKAATPFQPPPESSKPSGGETYRGGGGIPPKYQSPAPYQAPLGPASHLQSAHPAHPSNHQTGLDPRDFMPPAQTVSKAMGDYDALSMISKGHNSMSALLSARNKNLQIVRAMWSSGNVRTALESAIQMQDNSVIVDVLNVLNDKPLDWSLDVIDVLIRPLYKLLTSKFEAHVLVACSSLKLILKTYSPLIKQNLAPPSRMGVDISGEERHRRCMSIYREIQEIRQCIEGKHSHRGKLENIFREIQLLLNHLDS